MSYEWQGKVVLITGAANGIGAGVHIAILDVDETTGVAFQNELNAQFGPNRSQFYPCDVTNDEQLFSGFNSVVDDQGSIDVVINNAAIMNDSPSFYKKEIAINVTALVTSTLKALKLMRIDEGGKGGTVINISSIAGLHQSSFTPIYCGTKAAVIQFSNCIGKEDYFVRTGVRVLTVCFGATATSLCSPAKLGSLDKNFTPELMYGADKVVLITGAANGIGACVVVLALQEEAKHIAILDIDETIGVAFQEKLNKQHGVGKAKFYRVDVTSDEQLFAAFESVVAEHGGIDVVVNNAGIMNDMSHIYKKEIAINFHIAILDIDETVGVAFQDELNKQYGVVKAKFYRVDVTNDEQLFAAFQSVVAEHGGIDVVINNAAIMNDMPHIYKKEIAINTALVTSTLKAIELMRVDEGGKGGTVINISSVAGLQQTYFTPIYCGTKAAVLHFSSCIGIGVRVFTLCFGVTATALCSAEKLGSHDKKFTPENMYKAVEAKMYIQKLESAAKGMIEVYKHAKSGSTWIATRDLPVRDITGNITRAYQIMGEFNDG
ncbi:hypothetical protein MSG28_003586 [Choristoneura fumiferana]|uniref:Uncharacterized protein n=1 Tax=Choristoneura fumiferana TaxID=7141 RepID=A0ACC0KG62_CHOFU|nr:hypothetical protein MSG28_003586 [Choristoneura fumiferana]